MSGSPEGQPLRQASLDDMGPGTDMGKPAGAVSRSLFKKQTHAEAHGSDFGIPGEGEKSLFRKNSLDEMTVRRTEKPVEGTLPPKPVRGGEVRCAPSGANARASAPTKTPPKRAIRAAARRKQEGRGGSAPIRHENPCRMSIAARSSFRQPLASDRKVRSGFRIKPMRNKA